MCVQILFVTYECVYGSQTGRETTENVTIKLKFKHRHTDRQILKTKKRRRRKKGDEFERNEMKRNNIWWYVAIFC